MHVNVDKRNIEIDITHDHEWVERIGNAAYEMCNDLARNRIKLNEQHTGFIIESNYAEALGWAIEQHLDALPPKLKPTFWKILDDTKTRKERFRKIVRSVP
ncbi:MAG: hypothetical protein WBL67_12200 [Nitrososphaeraceae archaeon]